MPNHPNMHSVLRGELVKKFEAVIQQEMADHQKVISSYHAEIQSLRDSVSYTIGQCESLFRHTELELKDKTELLQKLIDELGNRIRANDVTISDQRSSILSMFQTMNDFMYLAAKKSEFDEFKTDIDAYLKEKHTNQDLKSENHYRFIENTLNCLKEELHEIKQEMQQKIEELDEKIEEKFSISKMDKDSVIKQIKVYEKTIFIIEKKIENLYTLIERINKRGESCPKQAL